ncbi:MAG: ABC transporter ATP-binding protein [Bacilli bacterium]|nr:ABC transporter ATP-binding protein [Bacilli bacterium]
MSNIQIKDLSVTYLLRKKNTCVALESLNADFYDGKINVILGPSGCGKTTLLRAIAQQFAYDGEILFDGVNVSTIKNKNRNISYVDQNLFLFGNMIVYDLLAFPLKQQRIKADEIDRRVKEMVEILDIKELITRKPKQLSIGQRQKVSLGKALIKNPSVCLLDEPFSNLDPESKEIASTYLKKVCNELHTTVLFVTHSYEEAITLGDYIYYLDDSKIKFCLTPDELAKSEYLEELRNIK